LIRALKNSGRKVVDPYLNNIKTGTLDISAALHLLGYKNKSAPKRKPSPIPKKSTISTPPPKSSVGGSSGSWGAIQ
jgi:hypothetical protein